MRSANPIATPPRHGLFQNAKVIDYSAGGLQLAGTFGLLKRDPIEIELISGTRVPGQVAWTLGVRIGIAFYEQLPTSYPALLELSRPLRTRALDHVARGAAIS